MKEISITLAVILVLILGFCAGCIFAAEVITNKVVDIAQHFIDIDEQAVRDAIWLYSNQLGTHMPPLQNNALINAE